MLTAVIVYDQGYISGGAAQIAIGEAIGLKERGHRVIFFCGVSPVDETLINSGIEIVCLNEAHIGLTKNPKALLKGIWNSVAKRRLEDILDSCDRDSTIVHIHGWTKCLSSSVFIASYNRKFKTIVTLHDYFTVCGNGGLFNYKKKCICTKKPGTLSCYLCNCDKRAYYQKLYRDIRQFVQNRVLKKTSPSVVYITNFSKKLLNDLPFAPEYEYHLNNFVGYQETERIRVEENTCYLYIGRLSMEKGIEIYCEAIRQAGVKGLVIGDGPLLEKYKNRYPEIVFVGWKTHSEMMEYVQKGRALIISSVLYETMGLTVLEMMSYGIPCIVPAECAPAEFVENGLTGLHYSVGNVQKLIECISIMENDMKVQEMSERFYHSIDLQTYSSDSHISCLEQIYEQELQ